MRDAHDAMLDQETGVRGYLASGNVDLLAPYTSGFRRSAELEKVLVASLSERPDLVDRAMDVITAQHAWQSRWAVPAVDPGSGAVAGRGDGRLGAAELSDYLQQGKELFDDYRAADVGLQTAVRADVARVERRIATTLLAAGGVLMLLGVVSLGMLVRLSRRLQRLVVAPVLEMTEDVDRVRQGHLDIEGRSVPEVFELAGLAAGVSAMTHSLAERHAAAEAREQELRVRSTRLEHVLELSRDLTESLSLRYTTMRLVKSVCELTKADQAELWLRGQDVEELVLIARSHEDAPVEGTSRRAGPAAIEIGVGAIGRAARYGRALPLDESANAVDDQTREVAIPMVVGARVVAVIAIRSASGPLDLSLIDGLLLQGASAIQAAQLHAEVEEISHKDALTGLANRRRFDTDLAAEVERAHRYDRPLVLIMLDLDHFKRINDVYGHQRGDEVLQDVAAVLTSDLRDIDTAYRYGGEELCVLMPESTAEQGAKAAERIRERIAGRFTWATMSPVTISAGVAQLGTDSTPATLVGVADQALYAAKRGGRDRVVIAE
nr:diguanylate cyclase [Aeromicrobium wangtongii]